MAPRAGHAVINVGDALRFLTGNRLRSALHRALQLEAVDRYAMAYFLRPNDEVEFTDGVGEVSSAVEWYLKKHGTYESSGEAQMDSVLVGGMETGV